MSADSTAVFGTVFSKLMTQVRFSNGAWGEPETVPYGDLSISPAAHVLHYASTCFEGLKAHKNKQGQVRLFRADMHTRRMVASANALKLPAPDPDMLLDMIHTSVRSAENIPETPGSLYIRPTLIGTTPNIGSAASPPSEVLLFVLTSPVGDYFGGKDVTLKLLINDTQPRSTPQLGFAKTGGNYAAAMGPIQDAKEKYQANQVLFCPDGDVQETGAANFILLREGELLTKPLDDSFLHGVTRDSVLTLARDMGYTVNERNFSVAELLEWIKTGEAALSGTAAVLSSVGSVVYNDEHYQVQDGGVGEHTALLRKRLLDIQAGAVEDQHNWLSPVT